MLFDNTKRAVIFNYKFLTFFPKDCRRQNGFNIMISESC